MRFSATGPDAWAPPDHASRDDAQTGRLAGRPVAMTVAGCYGPERYGNRSFVSAGGYSVDFDEDALPGALFGRFDRCVRHVVWHDGETVGTTRIGKNLRSLLDVREAVVEQREYRRCDLFAQAVARAQVLVDHTFMPMVACLCWLLASAVSSAAVTTASARHCTGRSIG